MESKTLSSGQVIGMLTYVGPAPHKLNKLGHKILMYYFDCSCGKRTTTRITQVLSGNTKSCGCLQPKVAGRHLYKHGKSGTPEHRIWKLMNGRCHNKKSPDYPRYGGRGIKICERWLTFENFLEDMGERPSNRHSIDRKDNDGDYCPENCRWATDLEQACNKPTTYKVVVNGETISIDEWARRNGLQPRTIRWRAKRWGIEEAIKRPVQAKFYKT